MFKLSVKSNIHKLEDEGMLIQEEGEFYLNNIAIMKLLNFINFVESVDTIRKHMDLWEGCNITGILLDD